MRRWTFAVTLIGALAGTVRTSGQVQQANADLPRGEPLRAMVWLQPDTESVLDRIRGQTNDLNVDLLANYLDPLPNDLNAQLQAANTLAARYQVSLVIWFVTQPGAEHHFVVHIAIPSTHRLLTRDLGPGDADDGSLGPSSVVKEGAALVVRAAMQAVLSGMTIGEIHTPRAKEASPARNAVTPVAGDNSAASGWRDTTHVPINGLASPTHSHGSAGVNLPWTAGLELAIPYDGLGTRGIADCASLRVERSILPVSVSVAGSGCAARDLGIGPGTVSIGRQRTNLGVHAILWNRGLLASVGVQAGAIFYERNTLTFPFGEGRAPRLHVLGEVGPEIRLLVPVGRSRISAGFALGVDVLSSSLKFGYAGPEGLPTAEVSRVQPYAAFGLGFRF